MIFREADSLKQAAAFLAGVFDAQMFERKFYGRDLVVGVKNLEIAGQPEALRFAAQQPCGKRVKCADPWIVERLGLPNQKIADALLHLRGRFVRERYSQNRASGHTL